MQQKQVEKDHYNFDHYCYPERWESYYYQIKTVLAVKPASILEVGAGDGVMGSYIKNNNLSEYRTLDIAEDLHPDVVGSVECIPLRDDSFDVVCAFEILEHLPFEKFEKSLLELGRVSKNYVIISLPHFGPSIKLCFKIPFLSEVRISFKIPFSQKHIFNGEHYWEIGKRGYSPIKIRNILKRHFNIIDDFVPFNSQYHHFYVLEKN